MSGRRLVAVLGYHKVGPPSNGGWETWYYVPEATFRSQLEHLERNGWEVVELARFLDGLADPAALPERAALLTFDDGYRSFCSGALDILRERGHPSVLFVPTGFVGARNAWDSAEPEEPICRWEDLCELELAGVSVQSHGVTHRAFSELDPRGLDEELALSKAALEDRLGKRIDAFAFPYGDEGSEPKSTEDALRRTGYRAAFLYRGGTLELPVASPLLLERIPIGADTDLAAELAA